MDQEYLSILNLYAPNKIFSFMKNFIKADKKNQNWQNSRRNK